MKNHLLNIILVLIIAIGGLYLMQPEPVYAQSSCPDCPTCSVEEDEDACTECKDANCEKGMEEDCGVLQSGQTFIGCVEKDGEQNPGGN